MCYLIPTYCKPNCRRCRTHTIKDDFLIQPCAQFSGCTGHMNGNGVTKEWRSRLPTDTYCCSRRRGERKGMVKKGKNKQFNGYYLPAVHTNETISGGEQCVLDAYIWVSLGGEGESMVTTYQQQAQTKQYHTSMMRHT